ncbi:MAG: DUF996 domain-containing protein [Candidatus Methanomethylicia archaeon]
MTLESNRTLGGIGAILIAIGSLVPFSGYIGILSFIGIILVLVAMKGLAEYYNEKGIFQNALYGFIFGIIGFTIAIFIFVIFFTMFSTRIMWRAVRIPTEFTGITLIAGLILSLVILVIFLILQAVFYKKSFTLLAEKSGEKMFNTAGMIMLIGAVLTIIVIGVILLLIAWILAAVAFLSIKTPAPTLPPPPSPA